jgi:terminase large subunit-like protein
MRERYANTRLERQELDGDLLTDNPGALWTEALLERCRQNSSPSLLGEGDRPAQPGGGGEKSDRAPHDERGRTADGLTPPPAFGRSPSPSELGEELTFTRLVIAVDPPTGDGTCGIIACAKDKEGRAHVLADHSVTARSPEGWAQAVADAAAIWSIPPRDGECSGRLSPGQTADCRGQLAPEHDRSPQANGGGGPAPPEGEDAQPPEPAPSQRSVWVMCPTTGEYVLQPRNPPPYTPLPPGERDPAAQRREGLSRLPVLIVAESNQGGLMVQSVLRIADPDLRIKLVPAVQGKTDRAAPVAMLFEAGKVALHGRFPELEAQLCGMIAGGDYEGPGNSPDRADAMVWGLTELMLQKERAEPRIRQL